MYQLNSQFKKLQKTQKKKRVGLKHIQENGKHSGQTLKSMTKENVSDLYELIQAKPKQITMVEFTSSYRPLESTLDSPLSPEQIDDRLNNGLLLNGEEKKTKENALLCVKPNDRVKRENFSKTGFSKPTNTNKQAPQPGTKRPNNPNKNQPKRPNNPNKNNWKRNKNYNKNNNWKRNKNNNKRWNKNKKKKNAANQLPLKGAMKVQTSTNNIIITLQNLKGKVVGWTSAGCNKFKGSRKSTAFAAKTTAITAARKALDKGLDRAKVEIRGVGVGRDNTLRGFAEAGFEVAVIREITGVPHNGCRPRKKRRL